MEEAKQYRRSLGEEGELGLWLQQNINRPYSARVNSMLLERSPAPLSSNASTLHAIFSISCVLPFQSSLALRFFVRVSAAVSKKPFLPNFTTSLLLRSLNLPFGMDDLGLPSRLFETCCEPIGKKRVNNFFNLRWIEVIKSALEDEDLAMLNASQFGRVLQMGTHTFTVMFLHFILSRQLVTVKEFELWWLFVGKPSGFIFLYFGISFYFHMLSYHSH
uniref:DUF1985 domain-containing protein n=2 Tax=Brassica oleracea TaxID=3712 RepID=A0A0D3ECU7_BRAOL